MEEENLDILPEGEAPADIQEQLDEPQEDIPRERGGDILDELTGTRQRIYGGEAKYGKFDQLVRDGKLKEAAVERRRLEELEEETNPETGWPNLFTSGTLESYIQLQEPSYWETDKNVTSFATSPMFSEQVGETQFPNLYSGGTATDYSELGKFLGASYTSLRDMDVEPVELPWYVKKHENYFTDGSSAFEYNNQIYENYTDIVFIGENAADVIQERFSKAWNWLPDEVKSVLVTGGKGLGTVTQWVLGPAGMQILQGIDNALTWTANQGANIAPIDPRLTKGILEFLPELVAGGAGTANRLRKGLDTFSDLNKLTYATSMGSMSGTAASIYGRLTGGENLNNLAKTSLAIKGTKAASGSQKGWKSKRDIPGFDKAKLQVYDEAAWDYRRARQAEGKKQFMKGFAFENNSPIIKNNSGQEFIMVRKKKVTHPDPTHPDNYILKNIWEVNNDLITKSGWDTGSKAMEELRISLNRLRTNHPDQFYHVLMEYGDNAYIEHKVAKKQPWFWNRRQSNPNFAPWLDKSITRNSEGNIRLLFNESFKALKDVIESKIRVINKNILDDNLRYIIDLEDPIGGDFAKRSNPGNILIREANSGNIIGIIPDYLQELFTTNFERNFKNSKMRGILSKPDIPEFYRIKPNETLNNYRSRILDERIQLIRNKSGQFDQTGMTGHINKDLVDFYELFDRQLGWVETPTYIIDQGLYN